MPTAEAEVLPRTRIPLILGLLLFVSTALFAQGTAQQPAPPSASSPSYLDPLPQDTGAAGLKQALRRLQNTGRLMMVTAHPDDEDGGVLTLQARGHGIHTVLMTLTRGEGGQNELGTGLFDKLGIIRTLELLASDRNYGVEQRFSRVADFGFSKTPEETFQNWGGKDVPLADMVRVIRTFRPDVLVARFSGTERDGHAHHQASAVLTKEAFRAAGDPNRFPEQIKEGLQLWQPKKLYIGNVCGFRSNTCADENWTVRFDTGEVDPVLGMSYLQMAMKGLAHQRTQGHFEYAVTTGPHYSFYKLVDSVLPKTTDDKGHEKDFFDGIDTTPPAPIRELAAEAEKRLAEGPEQAVEPLAELFRACLKVANRQGLKRELWSWQWETGKQHPVTAQDFANRDSLREKLGQSERALQDALGISMSALAAEQETANSAPNAISPGQHLEVAFNVHNGSSHSITINSVYLDFEDRVSGDLSSSKPIIRSAEVTPGQTHSTNFKLDVPTDYPISRPYWKRTDPQRQNINSLDNPRYLTLPLPPPPFVLHVNYSVAGLSLSDPGGKTSNVLHVENDFTIPILVRVSDSDSRSQLQSFAVEPEFSVALDPGEQVLPLSDGTRTTVKVNVTTNLTGIPTGALRLDLPTGWGAEPATFRVSSKRGDKQDFSFKVFPGKLAGGRSEVHAVLDAAGKKYTEGYEFVGGNDIGFYYYYRPAVQHVSIVDVKIPKDLRVAYIQGAGEDTPTVLQQVGMNITVLPAEKLATEDLSQFGTIVLGVRAYDAQKDVVANNAKLLKFVENGGTLVVEHNNDTAAFNGGRFTPYPVELSRTRVSVEQAPVQVLAPDDPIFHYPNEISQKDFDGWVQERGLYFMSSWDEHFKPLISCHDPSEPDQKGGLLMAKYGKGTYIYSGYSFYRELPAGVPGAVRLFVNLVSAGHEGRQ